MSSKLRLAASAPNGSLNLPCHKKSTAKSPMAQRRYCFLITGGSEHTKFNPAGRNQSKRICQSSTDSNWPLQQADRNQRLQTLTTVHLPRRTHPKEGLGYSEAGHNFGRHSKAKIRGHALSACNLRSENLQMCVNYAASDPKHMALLSRAPKRDEIKLCSS